MQWWVVLSRPLPAEYFFKILFGKRKLVDWWMSQKLFANRLVICCCDFHIHSPTCICKNESLNECFCMKRLLELTHRRSLTGYTGRVYSVLRHTSTFGFKLFTTRISVNQQISWLYVFVLEQHWTVKLHSSNWPMATFSPSYLAILSINEIPLTLF